MQRQDAVQRTEQRFDTLERPRQDIGNELPEIEPARKQIAEMVGDRRLMHDLELREQALEASPVSLEDDVAQRLVRAAHRAAAAGRPALCRLVVVLAGKESLEEQVGDRAPVRLDENRSAPGGQTRDNSEKKASGSGK